MDILVDLDASLVFPIADVDCREEVDAVLAFRTAYGPPAASDAHLDNAACPRLVDKAVKWFECKVGLLKAHSVAHDHVTAQQKGHLHLYILVPSSLEDKLHPRLPPLQGTHGLVELEDVPQKGGMKRSDRCLLVMRGLGSDPVDIRHLERDDEIVCGEDVSRNNLRLLAIQQCHVDPVVDVEEGLGKCLG